MTMKTLKASLREERKILRCKERVTKILEKLPDDESRYRVVVATAALHGFPVCTQSAHLS